MTPSFQISVDPYRKLVSLTLTGFFTLGDAEELIGDMRTAIAGIVGAPNGHLTLCDVSACKLQPQNVVAAFAAHVRDPRYRSRRLAFVVGGSVSVMQVRRMLDRGDVECFGDREAAEAWLTEADAQAA